MSRVLVIIPARGGSKGIPRKNLRPLAGRPLISYAIETALRSRHAPDVYVSSEDDEILNVARKLGANTHRRAEVLAADDTTLDDVVVSAFREIRETVGRDYDVVVTLQPTSPLLTTLSLDQAIDAFEVRPDLATLLTAAEDTHLRWGRAANGFVPRYTERVNRQYLEPVYRETGGMIVCRGVTIATGSRIGQPATLQVLTGGEAIDIDSREDWALCEWYLSQRDILFVVAGFAEIGLGHVQNSLTIANELVRHRIRFLVTTPSELAQETIAAHHYEVHRQRSDDLVEEILQLGPDVVINDRLDTEAREIGRLKEAGLLVVNFEDLGTGAREADLVINAIYPETQVLPHHHFGPRFFCPRAEFVLTQPRPLSEEVRRVLVTFGGVDQGNLTYRVVDAIYDLCRSRGIALEIITGRGYAAFDTLAPFVEAQVSQSVIDMADRIRASDIVVTSAGRTVFEVACMATPGIVLAQNERELTHFFASPEHGFVNLGLGADVDAEVIRRAFNDLVDDPNRRREMQQRMLDNDLRSGTERVARLIRRTVERHVTR